MKSNEIHVDAHLTVTDNHSYTNFTKTQYDSSPSVSCYIFSVNLRHTTKHAAYLFLWSASSDSGNVIDLSTNLPNATSLPPLCPGGCRAIPKPIVDSSATVYVVFGLKKIDRSKITREHVIEKKVFMVKPVEVLKKAYRKSSI